MKGYLDMFTKFARTFALAAGIAVVSAFSASTASAALINSGPGSGVCIKGVSLGGGACTLQAITPHPAWQTNLPGGSAAVWVSYANTGVGAGSVSPASSASFLMQVTETINVSPINNVLLNLKVWADDTAGVYLNGIQIFAPNFTQNTCANGPIGCQPNEFAVFNVMLAAGSTNTIDMQVYQTGGGPSGLLYTGSTKEAPEPSTIALIAMALLSMFGFGMMRRRADA
jgi:hypothetical protein